MRRRSPGAAQEPDVRAGLQWGIGCLVGSAALGGTLILVLLVAVIVQPPAWLQIVLGVALAAGATAFTWLFTSALRRSDQIEGAQRPRPVRSEPSRRRPSKG